MLFANIVCLDLPTTPALGFAEEGKKFRKILGLRDAIWFPYLWLRSGRISVENLGLFSNSFLGLKVKNIVKDGAITMGC